MQKNKKAELAIDDLLTRQNYLVVQGNDLAKSFGGLKSFEQRVLDYCFSFVKENDKPNTEYTVAILDIIKHFDIGNSGDSYKRIGDAFKKLNENTALYLPIEREGVPAIRMTQLFSYIDLDIEGQAFFRFNEIAAPYVFDLRKNFYSFKLGELSRIKGKYALILLKLWESYRRGNEKQTTIKASLEDWESWFLGKEKRLPAGQFYQKVITRSVKELDEKMTADFFVTTLKRGRKVEGYEITFTDTSI